MNKYSEPTSFYQEHLGDLLIQSEQQVLKSYFDRLFGLHLVWIGYNALAPVLETSLVQHKLVLGDFVYPNLRASKLSAHPERLGIQPDSIDVVILAHALENSLKPHQVLREAYRILRPEGQLFITGFNPFSMLGIWHSLKFKQKLFSVHRMVDWCQVLDLELLKKEYFFYRPPIQHAKTMDKLEKLDSILSKIIPSIGGGYCLNFVKRVAKLTPIRPKWRTQQKEDWVAELET